MGHLMRLFLFPDEGVMKRVIFFVFFGLGGFAVLVSLGTWQIQRLTWKQEIIEQIERRILIMLEV